MSADLYLDLPSPFGLSRPTDGWCRIIAHYDSELRIFPSQTHPVYRLMRKARTMGPINAERFKAVMTTLHPDTQIAINHHLIAVFTLPKEITTVSPERVVEKLRRRDQWQFKDGDAVADALDRRDDDADKAVTHERNRQYAERRRAAGISLLYRTGARVSLVSPVRPSELASMGTPAGKSAGSVALKE
jgi:hypothetical protein